jgi:hypothetical protein
MKRIIVGFLAASTALLAPAADAQDYHPMALVAAIEDLYNPSPFAPRAPTQGSPEVQAHRLLRDEPDSMAADDLRELLSPPPEAFGEAAAGPRAPGAIRRDYKELRTKHFRVLYTTQGSDDAGPDKDGDGVPDKARWAADAFELAYKREVLDMGYPTPPDIPNYVVVLKRLKVNALTHPEGNGRTWCEFNFAMREGSSDAKIQEKFVAVAAHEFFHAIQATLNWDETDWWVEGSSDWMSHLVDPKNFFFHANAKLRFKRPEVGLESKEPFFPYAGSLFAAYLTDRSPEGRDLIKETWLACGKLRAAARSRGDKRRRFIREAITETVGPWEETVAGFWPRVYLRHFPGGKDLPAALRVRVKSYPATVKPDTLPRADRYGANFFEFHPEAGHEDDTLVVKVHSSDPKAKFALRVVTLGVERWESHEVKRAADGTATVEVAGLGRNLRAVTLSLVNMGKKHPIQVDASWR